MSYELIQFVIFYILQGLSQQKDYTSTRNLTEFLKMPLQKQGLIFPNLPEITITRNEKTLDVTKKNLKNTKNKRDLEGSTCKKILGLKESSFNSNKKLRIPIDDSIKISSIGNSLLENEISKFGNGFSNQQFLNSRRTEIKSGEFKKIDITYILILFHLKFSIEI